MGIAAWKRVTPDKVRAYVERHPIAEIEDIAEREHHIRKVAAMINQLDFEERREARENRDESREDPFWRHLTADERALMVELTVSRFFDNLIAGFNQMEPEERKKIAEETIRRLREGERLGPRDDEALGERGAEVVEKVMSEGIRAYYQEASAETKIDFAPVLEELQSVMQNPRRRRR